MMSKAWLDMMSTGRIALSVHHPHWNAVGVATEGQLALFLFIATARIAGSCLGTVDQNANK